MVEHEQHHEKSEPTDSSNAATATEVPAVRHALTDAALSTEGSSATHTVSHAKPCTPGSLGLLPQPITAAPVPQNQNKKRKLHANIPSDHVQLPATSVGRPPSVTQLMVDYPIVQQTVRDLLALLQSYGPLTAGQLEYNLPIVSGERLTSRSLHEILEVLVCVGIVQKVLESSPLTQTSCLNHAASKATAPLQPRYCVCQGVPRADVILPNTVLDEVAAAVTSARRSSERTQVLIDALKSGSTASCKEILKKLLLDYPELVHDPVYVTAFKNCHVEVAAVERERRHGHKNAGSSAKERPSTQGEPNDSSLQKSAPPSSTSGSASRDQDPMLRDVKNGVDRISQVTVNAEATNELRDQ